MLVSAAPVQMNDGYHQSRLQLHPLEHETHYPPILIKQMLPTGTPVEFLPSTSQQKHGEGGMMKSVADPPLTWTPTEFPARFGVNNLQDQPVSGMHSHLPIMSTSGHHTGLHLNSADGQSMISKWHSPENVWSSGQHQQVDLPRLKQTALTNPGSMPVESPHRERQALKGKAIMPQREKAGRKVLSLFPNTRGRKLGDVHKRWPYKNAGSLYWQHLERSEKSRILRIVEPRSHYKRDAIRVHVAQNFTPNLEKLLLSNNEAAIQYAMSQIDTPPLENAPSNWLEDVPRGRRGALLKRMGQVLNRHYRSLDRVMRKNGATRHHGKALLDANPDKIMEIAEELGLKVRVTARDAIAQEKLNRESQGLPEM